jgi:predicted DNA-binding protein
MKITVNIPDELGQNLKKIARKKDKTLSFMTKEALENYIKFEERRILGQKVLDMIGQIDYAPNIEDEINEGRKDCDTRS